MEYEVVLGIDIGGTSIKLGAVKGDHVIENNTIRNVFKGDCDSFLPSIKEEIEYYLKKYEIHKIGIGCPGQIKDGVVVIATNLGWKNYHLLDEARKMFPDCKVELDNDGNAACLAEVKYGYLQDCDDGLFITIGRGVGGAIIIDKKVVSGSNGLGGCFGHMVIHTNGRRCTCGRKGCFETYASVTGLIRTVREENGKWAVSSERIDTTKLSGRVITNAAKEGNKPTVKAVKKWNEDILSGLLDLSLIFDPSSIVIAGGITESDLLDLEKIKKGLADYGYDKCQVVLAKYKGKTGLIGASALVI